MDLMHKFTHPSSSQRDEQVTDDDHDNKELSFRSKGLTADDIQGISSLLANTKELDLSDNDIDKLSRGFPMSLIALDLSSNRLPSLAGFENLRNIRMLRLQHNKITSTWGLQECVNLVHLDLTHNRVKVVEGLESLTQLRTLLLTKNYINTMDCIRSLSFNTALEELSLKGNKVTIAPNYRGFTKHLIASLKKLDGKALYLRDGNRCPGYGVRFECKNTVHHSDADSVMTMINSHLSVSTQGTNIPPAAAHIYFENSSSFSSDESVISASSSQVNLTRVGEDVTDLPWRRPPSIVPKDVKGRQLYDSKLNISQLDESKNRSKTNNKPSHQNKSSSGHYTRHRREHTSPTREMEPPPPPEKWDENFVYESYGSPSKRVTGGVEARGDKRHLLKGGGSVGTGSLRNAILGSRRYETPPPPPPKVNKYPLTLGVEKPGLSLTDATIPVGNEVLKVPLLASPGMVQRLSPKKSTATPLFPGAEQLWEGHTESLEHDEQHMTEHFRDQVFQQHEENFRNKQASAPLPPPLPSEQFDNQYLGEDDEDDYSDNSYSESYEESRDDREGEYYSEGEDRYDSAGEYYEDNASFDHAGARHVPDHSSSHNYRQVSNLTSQKRGTFFGLYSNNTPDSKHESRNSTLRRADLSATKSAGTRAAGGKSGEKSSPTMTSQRRGTFFGLYKKPDTESSHHRNTQRDQVNIQSINSPKKLVSNNSGQSASPKDKLTSQRRGTFFGLYKKDTDENLDQNKHHGHVKSTAPTAFIDNVRKPLPSHASPPRPRNSSNAEANSSTASNLTSQKRGTFFGLYPSKTDSNDADDAGNRDLIQFNTNIKQEQQSKGTLQEVRKKSPEDLQNVLQQMYERKVQSLRTMEASRDQVHHSTVRS